MLNRAATAVALVVDVREIYIQILIHNTDNEISRTCEIERIINGW